MPAAHLTHLNFATSIWSTTARRAPSVATVAVLVATIVPAVMCPSAATAKPAKQPQNKAKTGVQQVALFGEAQFTELLDVLAKQYIERKLSAPHIWSAAANGAVTALRQRIELLPSSFVALKKFSETRFSGKTEPFKCQGRSLPGVVSHVPPRPKKGAKPYGSGGNSTGEALVDAALAWPPPFTKKDFECVVHWVSSQLVGRTEQVQGATRVKRLPDELAKSRRRQMWLTSARWMLRALDPHSKLTTIAKWQSLNAPVDSRTKEDDVTAAAAPGLPGAVIVRMRKFAPGGDARVRAQLDLFRARFGGKLTGIVLDMRDNGGGILPVAVGLVETFMRGGLVTRVKTRDAIAGVPVSRRTRDIVRAPLVILVNERCASACEFTSGALQDGLRALVVGERTYGKATLQEYTPLASTNMKVMITTAMFFSPSGHPIQATGISPDVLATAKSDNVQTTRDREEDVPFHLQAETLAEGRDRHYFKPWVVQCAAKSAAVDKSAKDHRLARAVSTLRCLNEVQAAYDKGALTPLPKPALMPNPAPRTQPK
jgi:hypothetical protein